MTIELGLLPTLLLWYARLVRLAGGTPSQAQRLTAAA
jgi:hypothetical protein